MMKVSTLLAIALLTACSSSGIVDDQTHLCGPGQDIEIAAGLNTNVGTRDVGIDEHFELLVEVANNSHEEVTVKDVRVDQINSDSAAYRLDGAYRKVDQVIEEGKDRTFHLQTSGRWLPRDTRRTITSSSSDALAVSVTVRLSDGDSYRCQFDLGGGR